MWRHPKYYKELRKRNRDLLELSRSEQAQDRSVPQSDQAISYDDSTESQGVRPGPGPKLPDSTMVKQRASSSTSRDQEPQATSSKRQASSSKLGEK